MGLNDELRIAIDSHLSQCYWRLQYALNSEFLKVGRRDHMGLSVQLDYFESLTACLASEIAASFQSRSRVKLSERDKE